MTESRPSSKRDSYCALFWRGLDVADKGGFRVCCSYDGGLEAKGRPALFERDSVTTVMTDPHMAALRAASLAGEPIPGCRACYAKEDAGARSDRQIYNQAADIDLGEDARTAYAEGRADPEVSFLSLHLGSTCNLACRMCRPEASSRIAADPVHAGWAQAVGASQGGLVRRGRAGWARDLDQMFADGIGACADTLRVVQISGGEPFVMSEFTAVLDRLIDAGAAPHIELAAPTNATQVTDRHLAQLAQFKSVRLRLSLDGVHGLNDYVRWPAVWERVEPVVDRLETLANVRLAVGFTLNAYNVFGAADVFTWSVARGFRFEYGVVTSPRYLDTAVLPDAVRRQAAEHLDARAQSHADARDVNQLQGLGRLLREQAWAGPDRLKEFMTFTNDMDATRGQSFAQAEPRLHALIAEAAGGWSDARRLNAA
ncbi:MAG: twitch domain-containing radical SAM protein [Maricaulaceae bacterium]